MWSGRVPPPPPLLKEKEEEEKEDGKKMRRRRRKRKKRRRAKKDRTITTPKNAVLEFTIHSVQRRKHPKMHARMETKQHEKHVMTQHGL